MGRLRGPRLTAVLQGPGCNVLSRAAFRLPWGQGVRAVGGPFAPLLLNNRRPARFSSCSFPWGRRDDFWNPASRFHRNQFLTGLFAGSLSSLWDVAPIPLEVASSWRASLLWTPAFS